MPDRKPPSAHRPRGFRKKVLLPRTLCIARRIAADEQHAHARAELLLSGRRITDAGLVHLQGLTNLKWLRLFSTEITDKGVAELKKALQVCEIHH